MAQGHFLKSSLGCLTFDDFSCDCRAIIGLKVDLSSSSVLLLKKNNTHEGD